MADEVEVEIKQETPPVATEVVIDKAKVEKPETKIVTADEGVAELKAQVERAKADSQRRLQEADRQIAEARRRAIEAESETATVKTGAVATVLDSLAKDKDVARRDLKAAYEAGDFEKIADATDRISEANARIQEAQRGKLELETQAKNPSQGRQVARPIDDPLDAMVNAIGVDSRSGRWLRAHPDYARDPDKNEAMQRAHYSAMGEGIRVESDDYFHYVERKLGIGVREPERETSRTPTAAPVGRDVVQSPGAQRPGTVRLSPDQVKAAMETLSPLYPSASKDELLRIYAKNRQDLIDEGKIGRVAS